MRTMIRELPQRDLITENDCWYLRGRWPVKWIRPKNAGEPPFVLAFKKVFSLEHDETVSIHVSADERYELYLDGNRIGRGPERGDASNWFFETYELYLAKGEHVIVARVWAFGPMAPYAQISITPGFILLPEERFITLLGTGVAEWQAKKLGGYEFFSSDVAWGTGCNLSIDGCRFDWDFECGLGGNWEDVEILHEGADKKGSCYPVMHMLRPAILPAMIDKKISGISIRFISDIASFEQVEAAPVLMSKHLENEISAWLKLLQGKSITVPPNMKRRIIFDLNDYYCVYPELTTTGGNGAILRLHWAESLFNEQEGKTKGHRDEIDGKYFLGVGDIFKADGGARRKFQPLWWQAGRYIELIVTTTNEPLTIDSFELYETRYPLEMESTFHSSDLRLERVLPVAFRGLQMCAHETYMDCPYYEQLQYIGDTRLEALVTYVTSRDNRLPEKALQLFESGHHHTGLTRSNYPSRIAQLIPPFSLWWVAMVYDYALWRGKREFIRSLMPKARQIIDSFIGFLNRDGLVESPRVGWNFCDWVPSWKDGVPPDGDFGVSGLINWQFVYTLSLAVSLEKWLGEPELANRDDRLANELAGRLNQRFWDETRGLFADTQNFQHYSEHTQCMAILSGKLSPEKMATIKKTLLTDPTLVHTTIYFSHYLFETYNRLGCIEAFMKRMDIWFDLEKIGLKTPYETPEPTRSDCHGWGSHPIYHYYTTILGIRPGAFGFESVVITPQPGNQAFLSGNMIHPAGKIAVEFTQDENIFSGIIDLPRHLKGTLVYETQHFELKEGCNEFKIMQ